jgi:hypothetical protein
MRAGPQSAGPERGAAGFNAGRSGERESVSRIGEREGVSRSARYRTVWCFLANGAGVLALTERVGVLALSSTCSVECIRLFGECSGQALPAARHQLLCGLRCHAVALDGTGILPTLLGPGDAVATPSARVTGHSGRCPLVHLRHRSPASGFSISASANHWKTSCLRFLICHYEIPVILLAPVLGKCSSTIARPLSPAADISSHQLMTAKCHKRP